MAFLEFHLQAFLDIESIPNFRLGQHQNPFENDETYDEGVHSFFIPNRIFMYEFPGTRP
jgi:hypothetical protein